MMVMRRGAVSNSAGGVLSDESGGDDRNGAVL